MIARSDKVFPGGWRGILYDRSNPRGKRNPMMPHFGGRNFRKAGGKPIVAVAVVCGLVFYLAYHLTRFQWSRVWPLAPRGDSSIIFYEARSIFEQAAYPTDGIFPYSPSAVLIFRGLGIGGPAAFMAAWYFLMAAGLVLTMRAGVAQERHDVQAAWPLIGAAAVLCADSPISWDLRNTNSNLIYLGLIMAGYGLIGRLPMLAGALIGLSVSFKLYSGLLLLWLFVNGPRRAVGAALITVLILWVVLPAILFGEAGTLALYAGWKEQLRMISDPLVHASFMTKNTGPPLVTLERAIVNFTGGAVGSSATLFWLSAVRSIWVAALLWYLSRCRFAFPVAIPSRAALADWIVLLLAPLPFSPWLEPYHAIPIFVGAVLCVTIVLDDNLARSDRMAALAAMATLLLFIVFRVPFGYRGFGLGAQFLVLVLCLGYMRPRLQPQIDEPVGGIRSA
jgi:hypothetical protein